MRDLMLCKMMHAIMTSAIAVGLHSLQGSVRIRNRCCSTPYARSTSFLTPSCIAAKTLRFRVTDFTEKYPVLYSP
ncbi:hypothetical protein PF008_g14256 [Phytophthora fragariae]|uniref:RxLR effector protein n=1 Tax=Phytophthora fragariae TaxID=53985 RepID=A0A6G0RI09_9STRA|nr:hypothetical protein PF008_g14256 [Phytophthora fragariae]